MKEVKVVDGGSNWNVAQVSALGELHICLCKKACKGTIKLSELEKMYPNIRISIRNEQIEK
jgi:hypothetical protein